MAMESDTPELKRIAAIVLRHIANNHACLEVLCHIRGIQYIVNGMKKSQDMLPVTCEALNHLYSARHSELVSQALQSQLIPLLLNLLKHGGNDLGPNAAATKANIVHALQSMAQDEKHGPEVDAILSKSDVWLQYRDQKHDLFLSDRPIAGYLTGSSTSTVAGYLTQGSLTKSTIPTSPPPLID
jgi:DnaJ family protein C protein 13